MSLGTVSRAVVSQNKYRAQGPLPARAYGACTSDSKGGCNPGQPRRGCPPEPLPMSNGCRLWTCESSTCAVHPVSGAQSHRRDRDGHRGQARVQSNSGQTGYPGAGRQGQGTAFLCALHPLHITGVVLHMNCARGCQSPAGPGTRAASEAEWHIILIPGC